LILKNKLQLMKFQRIVSKLSVKYINAQILIIMSEDNQNNGSQTAETFVVASTTTITTTANQSTTVDFNSSIYRNPDYGNIWQSKSATQNKNLLKTLVINIKNLIS